MIFNDRTWLSWNQQSCIQFLYITLEAARVDLPRHFGFSWPLTILYFKGDQVYWLNRWEELRSVGFKMLDCLLIPGYSRLFFEEHFPEKSSQVERAVSELSARNLSELTSRELISEYNSFLVLYRSWYALGWYAEPLQFCAESILEDELRNLEASGKIDQRTLVDGKVYLYTTTRPTYTSEINDHLLKIVQHLFIALAEEKIEIHLSDKDTNLITINSTKSIQSNDSLHTFDITLREFYDDYILKREKFSKVHSNINEHVGRYFWKLNNYYSTQVISGLDVFTECINIMNKITPVELPNLIGESERRIANKQQVRDKIYNELRPYYRSVVNVLSKMSYLKDIRKKVICQANHAIDLFLVEIAKRLNCKSTDLRELLPEEIEECINSEIGVLQEEIERRKNVAVIFWGEQDTAPITFTGNPALRTPEGLKKFGAPVYWAMNNCVVTSGETAESFINALNDKFLFLLDWGRGSDIAAIRGECVSSRSGEEEIRGVVRIITNPKSAADFQKGDILVAPTTTPDYVPIMRLARCIITDWGGWTSHAALVARELGIPCIIGSHHASQVLSSGQQVIIRVREGVVIPIKQKIEGKD